jgi:hypothetical protein
LLNGGFMPHETFPIYMHQIFAIQIEAQIQVYQHKHEGMLNTYLDIGTNETT